MLFVIRLDQDLIEIANVSITGHNQVFNAVAFSANGFLLGGIEAFGSGDHISHASFIKEYNLDGTTINTGEDIALTEITKNGDIRLHYANNEYYIVTIPSIYLTIENHGQSVVNEADVNLHFPTFNAWDGNCYIYQNHLKHFTDLNIQPGSSVQVYWGHQQVFFEDEPNLDEVELCFWTANPNNHLETNNDNDVSCTSFPLVSAVRYAKSGSVALNFNPSSQTLSINLDESYGQTKLNANVFNAAGQRMLALNLSGLQSNVDVASLPPGTYLLQIEATQQVAWGKFVKY